MRLSTRVLISALVALVSLSAPSVAGAVPLATPSVSPSPRIIGGTEARIEDAPWQVALEIASVANPFQAQFCGGSIIADSWIVTAAHCVDFLTSPTQVQVIAGQSTLPDSGGALVPRVNVDRILINPDWFADQYRSDVALLHLATPLALNGVTVKPILLPDLADWPSGGTSALITGWGNSRSQEDPAFPTTLRKATVTVIGGPRDARCGDYRAYGPDVQGYDPAVMLCAGTASPPYIDTCQGDSGGPLAVQRDGQWYLAGITSWGEGCAVPGYPGIYTRVTAFTSWIRSAMAPGSTGTIQVTTTDANRLVCAYVYKAGAGAGPIATRCGDPGQRIDVPDVFPGLYSVRTSFEDRYAVDTWYSASGPQVQRGSASRVAVSAAKSISLSTASVLGSALELSLPSGASALGRDLCAWVNAISVDVSKQICLTGGSTSLLVPQLPASADGYEIYISEASGTYAEFWYTGPGTTGSWAREQAAHVLSPISATTAVPITLARAASVSGRLTLSSGQGPAEIEIYVAGVDEPVGWGPPGSDGQFRWTSMPPGTYLVRGMDTAGLNVAQWWKGTASRETATAITVSEGGSVTGIDLVLPSAGVITGRVTGPRGAALDASAAVTATLWQGANQVTTAEVGADGSYRFDALPAGSYLVQFTDASGAYRETWFGGGASSASATPVTVSAGQVTSGIDVALVSAQSIAITGKRAGAKVIVAGVTTGLAGNSVVPWVKVAGARKFTASKAVTVRTDGTFTWSYATPKSVQVYFKGGAATSSTIQVQALR